jgi:hypothetical protein
MVADIMVNIKEGQSQKQTLASPIAPFRFWARHTSCARMAEDSLQQQAEPCHKLIGKQ